MAAAKYMTCCYCGVHAVLQADPLRHALVCQSCGAPLRAQKPRPLKGDKRRTKPRSKDGAKTAPAPVAHDGRGVSGIELALAAAAMLGGGKSLSKARKASAKRAFKSKKKIRKSLSGLKDLLDDIWD